MHNMFDNNKSKSSKTPTIFCRKKISESDKRFVLEDGRVTGYNFLRNNTYLIRESSMDGVLTIDFRNSKGDSPDGDSMRCYLTNEGWIIDNQCEGIPSINKKRAKEGKSTLTENDDPKVAIKFAQQLPKVMGAERILEGLQQILPPRELAVTNNFYNTYAVLTVNKPEIEQPGAHGSGMGKRG